MVAAMLFTLGLTQTACQPERRSTRLTVASAGRIASLDPAQASTYGTLQLLLSLIHISEPTRPY